MSESRTTREMFEAGLEIVDHDIHSLQNMANFLLDGIEDMDNTTEIEALKAGIASVCMGVRSSLINQKLLMGLAAKKDGVYDE